MPRAVIEAKAKIGDRVSIILEGRETVEKVIAAVNEKTGARQYESVMSSAIAGSRDEDESEE
ncbi:hypothetical protein [Brucella intermedia]|uniref:hypothetical protein n=1 Tax=Brucella intermedia TaxID=94625 RepID=UPI00124C9B50|nr:hypothetical protein [Brucella intermedia]KAB2723384.1 hypothetical protein F9L02_22085 [Brucella intermedia]